MQGQPQYGQPMQGQPMHGQPMQGQPMQGQPQAAPQQQRPMAQPPQGSVQQTGAPEVLFEGTRKHSASFGGYLKWFLVSVAGGVAAYFLMKIEFFATWPLWALSLVGIPGMFWTFLRHMTMRYKVTRQRVEFERGVISKEVDSLELWRVLDVRYRQSIIDRILGNAKIFLIGTDQTDPELVLYGLPNHRQLFEQLREAVQVARHTGRPMELVGGDGYMENVGQF